MNRNEKIKEVADKLYNHYVSNGWKNVSLKDCEIKAINYVDTYNIIKTNSFNCLNQNMKGDSFKCKEHCGECVK